MIGSRGVLITFLTISFIVTIMLGYSDKLSGKSANVVMSRHK